MRATPRVWLSAVTIRGACMSTDKGKKEPRIGLTLFSELATELAQGDFDREVTSELAKAAQAAEATQQKAEVNIKIVLRPGPKMMGVIASIKSTIPRPALQTSQLFIDDKGGLHTENPRQAQIPFGGPQVVKPTDGEN